MCSRSVTIVSLCDITHLASTCLQWSAVTVVQLGQGCQAAPGPTDVGSARSAMPRKPPAVGV